MIISFNLTPKLDLSWLKSMMMIVWELSDNEGDIFIILEGLSNTLTSCLLKGRLSIDVMHKNLAVPPLMKLVLSVCIDSPLYVSLLVLHLRFQIWLYEALSKKYFIFVWLSHLVVWNYPVLHNLLINHQKSSLSILSLVIKEHHVSILWLALLRNNVSLLSASRFRHTLNHHHLIYLCSLYVSSTVDLWMV